METYTSTNPADYDILIRRYDNGANYASYCPQLAHMIKHIVFVNVYKNLYQIMLYY